MEKVQSQGGEWSTGKVLKTQSQGEKSADSGGYSLGSNGEKKMDVSNVKNCKKM